MEPLGLENQALLRMKNWVFVKIKNWDPLRINYWVPLRIKNRILLPKYQPKRGGDLG